VKWFVAVGLVFVAVVFSLIIGQVHRPAEPGMPYYEGKSLEVLLAELQNAEANQSSPGAWRTVESVKGSIRAMGTNALSFALADIHVRPTIGERVTIWAARNIPSLKLNTPNFLRRWDRGTRVLNILSPLPNEYIPELLLEATNGSGAASLFAVGADAVPAFTNLLASVRSPLLAGELMFQFSRSVSQGQIDYRTAAGAVPCLITIFRTITGPRRYYAADAIGVIHANPETCIPVLLSGPADKDGNVRTACIRSITAFGAAAGPYAAQLAGLYANGDAQTRGSLGLLFGNFADQADEVAPLLVSGLEDPNDEVRGSSAYALGQLLALPDVSVPALIRAAQDPSARVRCVAVQSLGSFRARAKNAAPVIQKACLDSSADVRLMATNALRKVTTGNY
jgi:hypothetical protein